MSVAAGTLPPGDLVSAVIPSKDGTGTIERALDSLVANAAHIAEVWLVFSNSPEAYKRWCEALPARYAAHFRLNLVDTPAGSNGSAARNAGIDRATGQYVALLDDDDEWYADKLAVYLATIRSRGLRERFVLCSQVVALTPGDTVQRLVPQRRYGGEPIAEFILGFGGGAQTSALLLPSDFARAVRFDPALPRHQDYDFCMRLEEAGGRFEFIDRPLSIWHQIGSTVAKGNSFDFCTRWLLANRPRLTPAAFRAYIGKELLANARATGNWAGFVGFVLRHAPPGDWFRLVGGFVQRAFAKVLKRARHQPATASRAT